MEDHELLTLSLIAGLFLIAGMSAVVIGLLVNFKKRKVIEDQAHELDLSQKEVEKIREVVNAQMKERQKVAHDLHDEIGAVLSMAHRQLKGVLEDCTDENVSVELSQISTYMELSLKNLRNISQNLLPHFLINFGWQKTMERLCEQVAVATDIEMIYTQNGSMEKALDQQSQIHIYYIIMELINNIQKHAQARLINLNCNAIHSGVEVCLQHNGLGINQEEYLNRLQSESGVGLHSIAHRIILLSGSIHFENNEQNGAHVQIKLPI
jgi:signal transduction histidine kinase